MATKPNLSCSWANISPKELENVLLVGKEKTNIMDEISAETCLNLIKDSDSDELCRITMTFREDFPLGISSINLLSEARNVEFYGPCDEYITTIKGDLLDDFESVAVYEINTELQFPCRTVSIQFCSCPDPDKFWLYGLHITTCPLALPSNKLPKSLPSLPSTFNNPQVGQIMLANSLLEDKLRATEQRVMDRLDEIEKKLNEKLDLVLRTLAKLETK